MVYKELGSKDDMAPVGSGESRPVIDPMVGIDIDTGIGVKRRFVMRGLSVVERVNAGGEPFDSTQVVVMMPADFKDSDGYDDEFALSLGGQAAKSAVAHFADKGKLKETGEVWLDDQWVNKECDIRVDLVSRPGDEEKGYSPIRRLMASKDPKKSKRKDLPNECASCAAYQQPDRDDGVEVGGTEYQM